MVFSTPLSTEAKAGFLAEKLVKLAILKKHVYLPIWLNSTTFVPKYLLCMSMQDADLSFVRFLTSSAVTKPETAKSLEQRRIKGLRPVFEGGAGRVCFPGTPAPCYLPSKAEKEICFPWAVLSSLFFPELKGQSQ